MKTLRGKARAKNPRYLKLTQWFDYLPDTFQIWFARKFYFLCYSHLIVEVEVEVDIWTEPRPYGSTLAIEVCTDLIEQRFYISNDQNYKRLPIQHVMLSFIFGKEKALKLCKKAVDMAFYKKEMAL